MPSQKTDSLFPRPCTHSHTTYINAILGFEKHYQILSLARLQKMHWAPGCRELNAQCSFKLLCDGVTTGSWKVMLLCPGLPHRIDPLVICQAQVHTDSCPCNAVASISTHPQNSAGAVSGHRNSIDLSSLLSLSFPYGHFSHWPFPVELPSFFSWASWGLVLAVHGNKTPKHSHSFTFVITIGITISFHSHNEMERWS